MGNMSLFRLHRLGSANGCSSELDSSSATGCIWLNGFVWIIKVWLVELARLQLVASTEEDVVERLL